MFGGVRAGRRSLMVLVAVASVVVAGVVVPVPVASAAAGRGLPRPYLGRVVSGVHARSLPVRPAPVSSGSVDVARPRSLVAGTYRVNTPSGPTHAGRLSTSAVPGAGGVAGAAVVGAWEPVGRSGLAVAAATGARAGGARAVGAVVLRVLTAAQARAVGVPGLVLELARVDGVRGTGVVAIRVPDGVLAGAFGGDYLSRVRWREVAVPAGGRLTARGLANSVRVPQRRDAGSSSMVVTPQVGVSAVMLAATSGPVAGDGTGSFAATPVTPSSSWAVSAQTGGFSWSYPMSVPPAPAGPAPSMSLTYNSQLVDGETGSTNNQPGQVGDGWELSDSGSISRSYVPCSLDDGASGPVSASGDLCWSTDNATLSLGGHSGQLVKDASGVWKVQGDDGSRVEHLSGAASGCGNSTYDDDCWRVTTTDGTQYYFGRNQLPGYVSGDASTNSVWTVPVFGNDPGEPCHGASFAVSSCVQAWRWNLDYVVDPHGNSEAFYYTSEANQYLLDGLTLTSYIRGGYLTRIDYGMRAGHEYDPNAASGRVLFTQDPYGRCSDFSASRATNCTAESGSSETTPANPSDYPDTPWDQSCTAGPCTGNVSPTFWTGQMLSTITTQVWSAGSAAYTDVSSWALGHSFPATGDGSSPALWLTSITRTGYQGSSSITLPPVSFTGQPMQNRVLVVDGLSLLDKYRIVAITTDTGAVITVTYSNPACYGSSDPNCASNLATSIENSPQTNTTLAYPQWWTPDVTPPQPAQQDLFNKYVVTSVVDDPATGGANDARQETDYLYTGTPAWRFDTAPGTPDVDRTWDVYAGYSTVEVRYGDHNSPSLQHTTDYTFFQGLDGDPNGPLTTPTSSHRAVSVSASNGSTVPDSLQWAGQVREQLVRNGANGGTGTSSTPVLSDTINTPWSSAATAASSYSYSATQTGTGTSYSGSFTSSAYLTGVGTSAVSTTASTGTRTVTTSTSYDSTYGLPQSVEVDTPDAGDTCTQTSYAQNTSSWLIDYPARVLKLAVNCAATATYPAGVGVSGADVISDSATIYDGGTLASAPTVGDPTTTEDAVGYSGSTPTWQVTATSTFDALGRPLQVTDPRAPHTGITASTSYTPAGGGPLTAMTVTNSLGWVTTTGYDPAWGVVTSVTDPNGELTTASYDALGRRTGVWLPGNPQASYPNAPSTGYAYTVSATAASSVDTTTVVPNGAYHSVYTLYDGLGRARQTQQVAENGGTLLSDTYYNSTGQASEVIAGYYTNTITPSGTLFVPSTTVPGDVRTSFDGAGRPTASIQDVDGSPAWQTSYSYPYSDRTDTVPPAGGTPTSTYVNSRGQTSKLVQYLSTGLSGTTETTSYGYDARGDMTAMTSPAGSQWSWTFNLLGQQISASDPGTGTTTSSYYPDGDLQTSTDNRGKATTYSYDTLDRKTGTYDGTSTSGVQTAAWAYDPVISGTAVRGQLGSATTYLGGTAGHPGTGIAYTLTTGGYNALYEPTALTYTLPAGAIGGNTAPVSYTTHYSYGADGSLTRQVDPAMGPLPLETETYGYDTIGNLTGISGLNEIVGGIVYTYDNHIAQAVQARGSQELSRTFYYTDGTDRLREQLSQNSATTNYNVATRTYTYTNAGELTSAATTASTIATDTQCYSYDYQQNLTTAWSPSSNACTSAPSSSALGGPAPYWTSYTTDPSSGNRLADIRHATTGTGTDTQDSYSYPAATAVPAGTSGGPSAVASIQHATKPATGTTWTNTTRDSYSYDLDGDTTSLPGQTLTYDDQGHLTATQVGATSQNDISTPDGALLLQTDPKTGTTAYLGDTQLHAAPGATTLTGTRTYTAAGTTLAERTTSSTLYWLDADPQNTATIEINSSTGTITRRYQDPYGNPRGTTPTWSSNYDYLAKPINTLTQTTTTHTITQIGARNYDPTTGRFLTIDPLLNPADPQSINGYTYADNNPTTKTDPTGLDPAMHGCDKADTAECRNYYYGGSWTDPAPGATTSSSNQSGGTSQGDAFGQYLATTTGVDKDLNVAAANACGWTSFCMNTQPDRYAAGIGYNPPPNSLGNGCHGWWNCTLTFVSAFTTAIGLVGLGGPLGDGIDEVIAGGTTVETSTSETLSQLASKAQAAVGEGKGAVYGTRVHTAFASEINALGRSDLSTEISYLNGEIVPYATRGSVRLDVVEGNPMMPTAVYDLKTGSAALTPARVAQIQANLPAGYQNIPILEIRP